MKNACLSLLFLHLLSSVQLILKVRAHAQASLRPAGITNSVRICVLVYVLQSQSRGWEIFVHLLNVNYIQCCISLKLEAKDRTIHFPPQISVNLSSNNHLKHTSLSNTHCSAEHHFSDGFFKLQPRPCAKIEWIYIILRQLGNKYNHWKDCLCRCFLFCQR